MTEKIMLSGFNNLKKHLSFSFYDFVIATTKKEKIDYIKYINENYSSTKINILLRQITEEIEAEVINESVQDYEPYGASSLILLGDIKGGSIDYHLDKSHISAHTYPDIDGKNDILSFRVDIELSTCGEITPLDSLNTIFDFFDNDLVTIDYSVRGFTRKEDGSHLYLDHKIDKVSDFISKDIKNRYEIEDLILKKYNIWQTKMMNKEYTDDYFHPNSELSEEEKKLKLEELKKEMRQIFLGEENAS